MHLLGVMDREPYCERWKENTDRGRDSNTYLDLPAGVSSQDQIMLFQYSKAPKVHSVPCLVSVIDSLSW